MRYRVKVTVSGYETIEKTFRWALLARAYVRLLHWAAPPGETIVSTLIGTPK